MLNTPDKAHERYTKEYIIENQIKRKFQVTSFKDLLHNFNLADTLDEDSREQLDRIDYIFKNSLNLHNVKMLYSYIEQICYKTYSNFTSYIDNQFKEVDEVVSEKDNEIKRLNRDLDNISGLYE